MKLTTLVLLALLLIAPGCLAQQNAADTAASGADATASKEDIENYFTAMHLQDLMQSVLASMDKQMHQMVHDQVQKQTNLPPDFEAHMDKILDATMKNLPLDDLIQAMVPVYQRHFTKGDIDALTAFYSSPRGQRILKDLPAVTAEAMQASSGIIQKIQTQAMQRVQDEIAQVQKNGDGKSNPPAAPKPN